MVGALPEWPCAAYILGQAAAIAAVCNVVRESQSNPHRLWRFVRTRAQVCKPTFAVIDPVAVR